MITLAFPVSGKNVWRFPLSTSLLLLMFLSTPLATAQTRQQPFLIASTTVNRQEAVVTFLRDETNGVLTLLPAAPTPWPINVCRKQSANYQFRTPAGTYTLTVIPTVTAASGKSWQLNAIALTLLVN